MCKGNIKNWTKLFGGVEITKEENNVRFLKFTFAFRYIFLLYLHQLRIQLIKCDSFMKSKNIGSVIDFDRENAIKD